ncbi:Auxin-responsive family protein [Quillaja saponaria]|uniref:Auxin-responsive family protein n=1 Tax=Quillaja saponaria TaxID=32244 RepID=A0AAD7LMY0_QUISA|nr:Auxin-responsive family protein [Quillaja saponaria]
MTSMMTKICRRSLNSLMAKLRLKSKRKSKKKTEREEHIEPGVPEGFIPMHVGLNDEESKRYVIPISCLSSKLFIALLNQFEDQILAVREGPVRLPCSQVLFEGLLVLVMKEEKSKSSTRPCRKIEQHSYPQASTAF